MPDTFLGAIGPRPADPNEAKYALAKTLPPRAVDLTQPRLLSRWKHGGVARDVRLPVGDQGGMGSCAAWAAAYATMMAGTISGRAIEMLAPGPLYEQARRLRGWFPQDSGSYVADNCDLLLPGGPRVVQPYVGDATFDYDEAAWNGRETRDYEGSHRPFYPAEGNFAENVWAALDAGMPVVFASYWPAEWFNPRNGVVDARAAFGPSTGAHAYVCWGIAPGLFIPQNSWSRGWNSEASQLGFDCRPGDFAIPWEAAARGIIFEARAISFEPVIVPDPEPEPDPEPPKPDPEPDTLYRMYEAAHRAMDPLIAEGNRQRISGGEVVRDAVSAVYEGRT